MLGGLVAAAAGLGPRAAAAAERGPSAEQTVEYWHIVGNAGELVILERLAAEFRQQTGIRVKIQPIPWGHYRTKYFTAMASRRPPDAGVTALDGGAEYGAQGGLLDIGARFPEAVRRLREKTFAGIWGNCSFDGQLYAIPFNATALVGFYRKDIFARLGLQPPATWSELTRTIETLNAAGYPFGFLWTRNDAWALGNFTWPFGVDAFAADGLRVNWTDPRFVRGYTFAVDLWNSHDVVTEKAVELFALKDPRRALPMYFNYSLDYIEILIRAPHLRESFGIFPFPRPDDGAAETVMGGKVAVIFREARNPAGAMRWIEFLLSTASQLRLYHHMRQLGDTSRLDLSIVKAFWQHPLGLRAGDQQQFFEVYRRMRTKPQLPWIYEARNGILERSLPRLGGVLRRELERRARARGLSVRELKRGFAAGTLAPQRAAYQRFVAHEVARVLQEIAPQGQRALAKGHEEYTKYFGHVASGRRGVDILRVAEWAVGLLALALLAAVLLWRPLRAHWRSYLYVAPAVLAALVFIVIPIIVSLYLSLTRYSPILPLDRAQWVGLENYRDVLGSAELWRALGRSIYFALLVLPGQLVVGLILAACLDKHLVPDRLYKFVYFSPLVTSVVSVSLIWFALYAGTDYGWVNALALKLGLISDPIQFLEDKRFFLECVIVLSIWHGLAFYILILLAGLQNVAKQLYEAAAIDGAGPLRQFWSISLPTLRPQFIFLVIMGTIGSIQVFEQIYMMSGGAGEAGSKFGPEDSGMTIVPLLYRKGFEYFRMGDASAVAYILFVLLLLLTLLHFKLITRKE